MEVLVGSEEMVAVVGVGFFLGGGHWDGGGKSWCDTGQLGIPMAAGDSSSSSK